MSTFLIFVMVLLGILAFMAWTVVVFLIMYAWFKLMYSAKSRTYSIETRGMAYADQMIYLLSSGSTSASLTIFTSLQGLISVAMTNVLTFLKYVLISFVILSCFGLLWLEYHPEVVKVAHTAYTCAISPIIFSLPNLALLLVSYLYGLFWPILAFVGETIRYFTREVPIFLLFCSTISTISTIQRIGTIIKAFVNDTATIFTTIEIPESIYISINITTTNGLNGFDYGKVDYSQTFTEISGFAYYLIYGSLKCSCSSGDMAWDFMVSWLFSSNPNMTLGGSLFIPSGGISLKRGVNQPPPASQFLPKSSFGNLAGSLVSVGFEPLQIIMRCIYGTNPPLLPYSESYYLAFKDYNRTKTPGYLNLSDIIDRIDKVNMYNLYNNLTSIPGEGSNFIHITDSISNITQDYNIYKFPHDPMFGRFPNVKPLSEKIKYALLKISDLLDYFLYEIYYIILYWINGFNAPSNQDLAVFPPDNDATKFLFRGIGLIPDGVEFPISIIFGIISSQFYSCDIRNTRIFMDTGGASSLYYIIPFLNLTYLSTQKSSLWGSILSNPNLNLSVYLQNPSSAPINIYDTIKRISTLKNDIDKQSTKLRFMGTLGLFVNDVSTTLSYINPYFGVFVKGALMTVSNAFSGLYNNIWRTIIHLVDEESKMFPANVPPNGYPLIDSYQPNPYTVWPINSIASSDCSNSIYSNATSYIRGHFFVFMQDNYNEITGVHNSILYGLYVAQKSISDAILSGGSTLGANWILSGSLLFNAFWDSGGQMLVYINIELFFESETQRALFLQIWKFDEFPDQVVSFAEATKDAIASLDSRGTSCAGFDYYNSTEANSVCSLAFFVQSFFGILKETSDQFVLIYSTFMVSQPIPNTPNFDKAINLTEYSARNLTSAIIEVIPPVLVNSDGTTLPDIILPVAQNIVSFFFIFLTVPNYVLVKVASAVKQQMQILATPESAFATFANVIGSILQYIGDQLIFRGGNILEAIGTFLDKLFNTGGDIFKAVADAIILIINVIRNTFTSFAIQLLAKFLAVVGTFIGLFFDSQSSISTRLLNFFNALGAFILFFIVQAPTFLIDFIIGILNIILPPPLNIIIVTFLKLILQGLCYILQFFITVVISILNAFNAGLTPINLCCGGGCGKKRSDWVFTVESMGKNKEKRNVEEMSEMIVKVMESTTYEKDAELFNSVTASDIASYFVKTIIKKDYGSSYFKPFRGINSEDGKTDGNNEDNDPGNEPKIKYNIPSKKYVELVNGVQSAIQEIMIRNNVDYIPSPKNDDNVVKDHPLLCQDHETSNYLDQNRLCYVEQQKMDQEYISQNYEKRFALQNDTNTTNELKISLDDAIFVVSRMVPWNGSSGCDIFMRDVIVTNKTLSNFTTLEKIYVIDCISKRTVGEVLSLFPQFRWMPTDFLYDPFAIVKTAFDAIKAYKCYIQYQRDKVVPYSVFISASYKQMWSDYGLNTSYITEDNYENVVLNYTLQDYFEMNDANPAFIDALIDGVNMFTNNAQEIGNLIFNMSQSYKDTSLQYFDTLIMNYIKTHNTSSVTSSELLTMQLWVSLLESISYGTAIVKRAIDETIYERVVFSPAVKTWTKLRGALSTIFFKGIPFMVETFIEEKQDYDTFAKTFDFNFGTGSIKSLKTHQKMKQYFDMRLNLIHSKKDLTEKSFDNFVENERNFYFRRNFDPKYDAAKESFLSSLLKSNKMFKRVFMYTCEEIAVEIFANKTESFEKSSYLPLFFETINGAYFANKTMFGSYSIDDAIFNGLNSLKRCTNEKIDEITYKKPTFIFIHPSAKYTYHKYSTILYHKNPVLWNIFNIERLKSTWDFFKKTSPIGVVIKEAIRKYQNIFVRIDTDSNKKYEHYTSQPQRNSPSDFNKRTFSTQTSFSPHHPPQKSNQQASSSQPFYSPHFEKNNQKFLKRHIFESTSLNLNDTYPCVPSILGYCTNCILLDSTFSMFYQAGSRMVNNYSSTLNTSILYKYNAMWNDNFQCLSFFPDTSSVSYCGCLNYYFPNVTDGNLPDLSTLSYNPLAFPSGLQLLPGTYGKGTFFDVLGGSAFDSLGNYFSSFNILDFFNFETKFTILAQFGRPNSINQIRDNMHKSFPELNTYNQNYYSTFLHDPFLIQTLTQTNTINSIHVQKTKNFQKRSYSQSENFHQTFWTSQNYASKIVFQDSPSVLSSLFFKTFAPMNVLNSYGSITICEYVAINIPHIIGSRNVARVCDLFGWPEIQYVTSDANIFNQEKQDGITFFQYNNENQNSSSVYLYPSYPYKTTLLVSQNDNRILENYFSILDYSTADVNNNYGTSIPSDTPIRQTLNTIIYLNIVDPGVNTKQNDMVYTSLASYLEYLYMEHYKIQNAQFNPASNTEPNIVYEYGTSAPPPDSRIINNINNGELDLTYLIFYFFNLNTIANFYDYVAKQIASLSIQFPNPFTDFSVSSQQTTNLFKNETSFSYFDFFDTKSLYNSGSNIMVNSVVNMFTSQNSGSELKHVYYQSTNVPSQFGLTLDQTYMSKTIIMSELSNYFETIVSQNTPTRIVNEIILEGTSSSNTWTNGLLTLIYDDLFSKYSNFISNDGSNSIPVISLNFVSTIYVSYIQPNYDYTCEAYRRTTLFTGISIVTVVFGLLIGITSLFLNSIGMGYMIMPVFVGLIPIYLLSILIYTYNYPVLNLFPFMLPPPCLAKDFYEMWTCDILPKCPRIFYGLTWNHEFNFTNCNSCPSTLEFGHCKYDSGIKDGVDLLLLLIKWLFPNFFKTIISSSSLSNTTLINGTTLGTVNQLDYSIFGILTRTFPFSLLFSSSYFTDKVIYFSNVDLANIHTFDTYMWCFFSMAVVLLPQPLQIAFTFLTIFLLLLLALLMLLGLLLGLIWTFFVTMEAIMTTMLYNTVYANFYVNLLAVDRLLDREFEARSGKKIKMTEPINEEIEGEELQQQSTSSNRKRKRKINANMLAYANKTTDRENLMGSSNNPFGQKLPNKIRKPEICYRKGIVGYLYNNVWWARVSDKTDGYDYLMEDANSEWHKRHKDLRKHTEHSRTKKIKRRDEHWINRMWSKYVNDDENTTRNRLWKKDDKLFWNFNKNKKD